MNSVCAAALFLLTSWPVTGQATPVVEGDYVEARSNAVFGCYCEWSGESVTAGREAILVWNIRSGVSRGIDLSGVRIAAVVAGPETLSKGPSPRKTVILIDRSASKKQQEAVESLVRQSYPDVLGEVIDVRSASIEFEKTGDKARIKIDDLVDVNMRKARLPEDAMQGALLWYDPFIPLKDATLGLTLHYRYWGTDFDHRWQQHEAGVTGYFGGFTVAAR